MSNLQGVAPERVGHLKPVVTGEGEYIIPDGLTVGWEVVTPALARQWIDSNQRRNRNLVAGTIERYSSDIRAGLWQITHQGIAIDREGNVIDGQHRLLAICATGIPLLLLVVRGLDPRAMEVIDRGRLRTMAHTLQMMYPREGPASPFSSTKDVVSAARRMYWGPRFPDQYKAVTDSALRVFIDEHMDAILFLQNFKFHKLGGASFSGVIGRAFYTADLADLRLFCNIARAEVDHTEIDLPDREISMIKQYVAHVTKATKGGGTLMLEHYCKAQRALRAFLDHQKIGKLLACHDDLFPLPESQKAE